MDIMEGTVMEIWIGTEVGSSVVVQPGGSIVKEERGGEESLSACGRE